MKIRLEFKLEDMWVGVFWRYVLDVSKEEQPRLHIFICLLPCLPIHIETGYHMGNWGK